MRIFIALISLLICGDIFISQTEARRVRIQQPDEEEEQETVSYYAAEPQEERGQVVLVSSADRYNGLYGQQAASSRSIDNNYIPRGSARANEGRTKARDEVKAPPVQTIRNYNKVNDDGSFTFGYEAADGSFKEETRGTDCVVRGKYGYVDPDGNKREFTYVSGNPCDPNAPKEEEEAENEADNENIPANYPSRPIQPQYRRPPVTAAPKPAVTLFQTNYAQEEEEPEPEQLLRVTPQPQPVRRPTYISRPQYVPQTTPTVEERPNYRQQVLSSTTPSSVIYRTSAHPISITPRPVTTTTKRPQLPATTYRPQLLQVSVTPRPNSLLYSKQLQSTLQPTAFPEKNDFESEFHRFQQENNIVSPTPTPFTVKPTTPKPKPAGNPGQVYSTALVYDPSTGQYNNQIYQALPQSDGDFLLKQRIQPYVQRPRPQVLNIQQLQQQSPLYSQNLRPQPIPQAAYQAQQSELQFQNSAQLYAQQQHAREQQREQQRHQQQVRPQQQQVYYLQPSVDQQGGLAASQIDAFLRGHNIQF
ncbi:transcription factor SPT20 homolog isoform X2 [Diabrotica virgifera virgifera]|uniref:Uncharacterized protein n=1 Tax=Diabrotica virgifera virgifera TaxID=50390 RepID=A0ABM5I9B3_DIAVI|nr:transcription factor SPT20 homolog isoform X1 [Diabrotica virgifera virgifera]XP_050507360.1 transcription factor SPT20 homolog isoform X2 [Diabrotica virgifera virgifera]